MNPQLESGGSDDFIIMLEVVPGDLHDSDLELVIAVGRDTAKALLDDGYTIKPVYTGQRGGFLIDIVMPLLAAAWSQKDVILADGSALVTIFTPVVLIAKYLHEAHERRVGKDSVQQFPIKIMAEIDGASIEIEAPDLNTAEAAMKLARRFQTDHPVVASNLTSQSKTKIKGSVSKRPPRRGRKYPDGV